MTRSYDGTPKPVGSYPDNGINVLIVGTGLAGLTAALECVRKGCRVQVLERYDDINTAGDMYFMGLSATKFFKHWPEMAEQYKKISMANMWIETYTHDGKLMVPPQLARDRLRDEDVDPSMPPGVFQLRPLVYRMYVDQIKKLGVPIHFGNRVVDYYENESKGVGGVITDKGKKFEADIVIAADGIGSKSQRLLGGQVRAVSTERAMWRAAFPVSYLNKNPEVKEFFRMHETEDGRREPIIRTWLGPGTYALTLTRHDVMIWVVNCQSNENSQEEWSNKANSEEVVEIINRHVGEVKWAPIFKELIRLTPADCIINFKLFWRDPQPKWASPGGRVVNIGDAAHTFLPASSNGATQAIEDAVSLASCLQIAGRDNIREAVHAHVRMRFIRTACAQRLGFYNAHRLQETQWGKVKNEPKLAQPKLPRWVWEHDPEEYTYRVYDRIVQSMRQGVPLEEDDSIPPNYPPGYKYKPWSLADAVPTMGRGENIDLGGGNWD